MNVLDFGHVMAMLYWYAYILYFFIIFENVTQI